MSALLALRERYRTQPIGSGEGRSEPECRLMDGIGVRAPSVVRSQGDGVGARGTCPDADTALGLGEGGAVVE